jgi:hypothetical protein
MKKKEAKIMNVILKIMALCLLLFPLSSFGNNTSNRRYMPDNSQAYSQGAGKNYNSEDNNSDRGNVRSEERNRYGSSTSETRENRNHTNTSNRTNTNSTRQ